MKKDVLISLDKPPIIYGKKRKISLETMRRLLIMKKKFAVISIALFLVAGFWMGCTSQQEENAEVEETEEEAVGTDLSNVSVGVCMYSFEDNFITRLRSNMESKASALGIAMEVVDSENNQQTQNEKVEGFITKGVSALAVNPVDRIAGKDLIDKASTAGLPIVFFNREPEEDVMQSYNKVWYVGADAKDSGTLCGEIIADHWNEKKESVDRNADNKLQYIMITGEPGHQDTALRTEYSIKAIEEAGIEVEKIAEETGMWDKAKATEIMNTLIDTEGLEEAEAILCNNDDMALGVIEALQKNGYNTDAKEKYIPVVGIDATPEALEAMETGSLLGTVLNDTENQANAIVNIASQSAVGNPIEEETIGYEVIDDKYVWIPYVKITDENYVDFK